jgi:competence protein ComEA
VVDPISPLPDPADDGPDRLGFEHLGWTPTWRDRLEAAAHGTPPARLAAAAGALAVALVVIAVLVLRGPAPPPPELTMPMAGGPGDPATATTASTSTTSPAAVEVVVHAAGAVARPGVYRLAGGARVTDLLDAAGGAAPEADLDRLNLAALLVDGDRVFVPVPDQEVPPVAGGGAPAAGSQAGTGGAGPSPAGPIDLNAATAADLDALPGVGPSTAEAILAERERRGGFRAVEDLLEVRGIGDAKLAALRDLVRV